jgi:hypothetical protein
MRKAIPQPGQNFTLMESGPFKFWGVHRYQVNLGMDRFGYAWRILRCNKYGCATARHHHIYVGDPLYTSETEARRALALIALGGEPQ